MTRQWEDKPMRISMLVVTGMLAAGPALAQSEGFFKGKTVTINIAGTAGGGIDVGARIVARFLGKYLPGNPQVIAQNMPGAGGVRVLPRALCGGSPCARRRARTRDPTRRCRDEGRRLSYGAAAAAASNLHFVPPGSTAPAAVSE